MSILRGYLEIIWRIPASPCLIVNKEIMVKLWKLFKMAEPPKKRSPDGCFLNWSRLYQKTTLPVSNQWQSEWSVFSPYTRQSRSQWIVLKLAKMMHITMLILIDSILNKKQIFTEVHRRKSKADNSYIKANNPLHFNIWSYFIFKKT